MGKYNVTVIIPSLNPDEKLVGTVTELYNAGFEDIVIIDDGSDEKHKAFFPDLSEFPYCTIIHHRVNRGKGAALKTAFKYVIKNRDYQSGVVTVDAETWEPIYFGEKAKQTIGRTPDSMVSVHPIEHGVISDYDLTELMLKQYMQQAFGNKILRPRIMATLPAGLTELQHHSLSNVLESAGGRNITVIENDELGDITKIIDEDNSLKDSDAKSFLLWKKRGFPLS